MNKKDFKKVSEYRWELPRGYTSYMNVPAVVYASDKIMEEVFKDRSLDQLVNVTSLPGIQKAAFAMPDTHEGYGFPIGGVAAMSYPDGVISPGSIGFDINCGMRFLKSDLEFKEVEPHLQSLVEELFRQVPSGVGQGGMLKLNRKDMDQVLKEGAKWAVKKGYGKKDDPSFLESYGYLADADPTYVSERAKQRGKDQLGTMGAGNHFVEVDRIDQIYNEEAARAFGLFNDQVVFLIHTGSRGLGHQVATDYIRLMKGVMKNYKISVRDPQLACVPFSSEEGQQYFKAMSAAANFAWANRQIISWEIAEAWQTTLKGAGGELSTLYDVAHNIAKIEEHEIDGKMKKVIVHRKGATRAFGPGHPELVNEYKSIGQPVIIPGSMGTASYVLVGTAQAMKETFGSSCHGAGRRMSRRQAQKEISGHALLKELESKGIHIQAGSMRGLAEEAPSAYKDVDGVVNVVDRAGIAKKVARMRPVCVVKG